MSSYLFFFKKNKNMITLFLINKKNKSNDEFFW